MLKDSHINEWLSSAVDPDIIQLNVESLEGDYFLRIDYLPNLLFRWDGAMWVRISENVRTDAGYTEADRSLQSTFINNPNITVTTDGGTIPERQPLSSVLQITPDTLPPVL